MWAAIAHIQIARRTRNPVSWRLWGMQVIWPSYGTAQGNSFQEQCVLWLHQDFFGVLLGIFLSFKSFSGYFPLTKNSLFFSFCFVLGHSYPVSLLSQPAVVSAFPLSVLHMFAGFSALSVIILSKTALNFRARFSVLLSVYIDHHVSGKVVKPMSRNCNYIM